MNEKKRYRICFVGLGSIAKRHIANIDVVLRKRGIDYTIDLLRRKESGALNDEMSNLINNIYFDVSEIDEPYDVVFITNPTSKHLETLLSFAGKTKSFFIEKPVFSTSDVEFPEAELKKTECYVACPLRYTRVMQYLKEHLDKSKVKNVRVVAASYLPDWRPGTDYRKSYSARKSLGGGVSIDLVHEWDYITYLFGMPKKTTSIIKKISNLEIDSDDIAVYISEYEDMLVEVHLDYFSHEGIRRIEITTDDGYIVGDLINNTIRTEAGEILDFYEDRNDYQRRELECFFDIIEEKSVNENNIKHALEVLRIAEGK